MDFSKYYENNQLKIKDKNASKITMEFIEDGKISTSTIYSIYDGISIAYNKFYSSKCDLPKYEEYSENIIEIIHCRQGRFNFTINNGQDIFLGVGEMEANILGVKKVKAEFPLGFFEGIEILIDIPLATNTLKEMFPNIVVQINELKEILLKNDKAVLIKKIPELEHIFNELYSVKSEIREEYMKIKILEILTLLQVFPFDKNIKEIQYFSSNDIAKIRKIHEEITNGLEERKTIEQMSKKYNISPTQLKKCFKEIYGIPFYTYIKHYKMHKAIHYLDETELSITEIAGLLGYDNPSKFISAFKSIIKYTPHEYRKQNVQMEHTGLVGVEIED